MEKEYQKLTNRKNDPANKTITRFCEYETNVIQDEQLHSWHKGGHGKAVQHSVLGRVKKLLQKPQTVVLSSMCPTTKLCTQCSDDMKLRDRTFECDCGISMDGDVHAARTMVWMYENQIGVGCTKFKCVEIQALVAGALGCQPLGRR